MSSIRHARAPHCAFPRRRSHRTGSTRAEPGAMMASLPTRSTPSSVTSRTLRERDRPQRAWACSSGSTAGRQPAPIRCTVQACALVADGHWGMVLSLLLESAWGHRRRRVP